MVPIDPDTPLRMLRGLMRPLVRTLIAHGVTAPAFYRLLKTVYVEVADETFRLNEAPPTDSRITLLTGIHRRDVRAIRDNGGVAWENGHARAALFATVIGRWLATGDRDARGRPMPMPRAGRPGGDFESLVASVSRDIRPRTVLDELSRQGLVTEMPGDMLVLSDDAVSGPGSGDQKLVFFAANVGDHLAAAGENLLADTPPFLERAVFYNRLTRADVDRIETRARALSQVMLEDLNAQSAQLQTAGREAGESRERFRFGVYFYRTGAASEPPGARHDRDVD